MPPASIAWPWSREAEGSSEVGVAVLVVGHAALRELGPGLLDFAEQTGKMKPLDRSQVLDLKYETSLKHLFEWMEVTGNGYAHGTFEILETKQSVLLSAYLGRRICEPLSRFLTRRGCVTNLE